MSIAIAAEIVRNLRQGKSDHIVGEDADGELVYDKTAAWAVEDAFLSYFVKTVPSFDPEAFHAACKNV